ncbi:uncharacterized protein LOC128032072 isoform X2 [Gossypium raimondii]|uniref:uncharacterized protein LOC128032072 isoform X2 n=1 Tax=Gossypium raimondii TaxID=29730 RepID=UPI00227D020D|nr:uncharacterized protein LOC128032072 isoform X2 [Gossypium raimondii]
MSRTGKGSTSQTTESRDGFHSKEATKRLESIFKKQPMLPDKGFDLKNIDLTMVLSKIQKAVNALKWNMLCTKRQLYEAELVREFYLNLTSSTKTEVPVRDFVFDPWMPTSEAKRDEFITPDRRVKFTKGCGKVETISDSEDSTK